MVKRMIVLLGAMAIMVSGMAVAEAQVSGMPMCGNTGDTIMIPMKVKTSFSRSTAGTAGGDSTLMLSGCEHVHWWIPSLGRLEGHNLHRKSSDYPPEVCCSRLWRTNRLGRSPGPSSVFKARKQC